MASGSFNNIVQVVILGIHLNSMCQQHTITLRKWGQKCDDKMLTIVITSPRVTTCDRRTSLDVPISLKAIVNFVITGPKKTNVNLSESTANKHIELSTVLLGEFQKQFQQSKNQHYLQKRNKVHNNQPQKNPDKLGLACQGLV